MTYRNPSSPSSLLTFLFRANNSRHPSLQVKSHHLGTTAIAVKNQREVAKLPTTRHLRVPEAGPCVQIKKHKRATTEDTKAKQGEGQWGEAGGGQQRYLLFPLIHQFSPGLLKRMGASYYFN